MPTNTYVALDKITLASNGGTVTFTNIPQTYTDLRIVMQGGFVDNGFMVGVRVGNTTVDSGANYSYTIARGNNSVATSLRKTGMVFGAICAQGGNNLNNIITVDFLNYSNTTTYKTWISRYGNAGEGVDNVTSLWRSTAAINTIAIAESGDGGSGSFNYGNMLAGTTFTLYGIKAWSNTESTPKASGGYVYEDSTYYYHAFPFSSTFTPTQSLTCDYLVLGGGGGGGSGGGAGAYRTSLEASPLSLTAQAYTVTIGAGGASYGVSGAAAGTNGGDSVFSTITSNGGGHGGETGTYSASGNGASNGNASGGGAGTTPSNSAGTGGAYGNNGGLSHTSYPSPPAYGSGGGGGAGSAGGNGSTTKGGNGGAGKNVNSAWAIATGTGVNGYYAGGGTGSAEAQYDHIAIGGSGGGGTCEFPDGVVSTGSGGGGISALNNYKGGNGGSGLVILRYTKA